MCVICGKAHGEWVRLVASVDVVVVVGLAASSTNLISK